MLEFLDPEMHVVERDERELIGKSERQNMRILKQHYQRHLTQQTYKPARS